MYARQLQRFCNMLFMNLFVSFILLVVISQQAHCAQITNANTTEPIDPCQQTHCGPNDNCTIRKEVAICQCIAGYSGDPYAGSGCTRACEAHKDCYEGSACIRHKCVDPCPGLCGVDANCHVVNHNPICSCPPAYTGDPFSKCIRTYHSTEKPPIEHACQPSPCGPNSECRTNDQQAVCSCLPGYIGNPPNCTRPCGLNSDCEKDEVCLKQKCVDPCSDIPDFCGSQASCYVRNHNVHCSCLSDYTGDPFSQCSPTSNITEPTNHCHPYRCGPNANCTIRKEVAVCQCAAGFSGDPYTGCSRACEANKDCYEGSTCIRHKCVDPCPGVCGVDAVCNVFNHIPVCSCQPEYTGDAFSVCRHTNSSTETPPVKNPCEPTPCGPNSACRTYNGQAVCSCLPGFIGSPPTCTSECVLNSDCGKNEACIRQRCLDPCPDTCGVNAVCSVVNHSPLCSCQQGYTGDPFSICTHLNSSTQTPPIKNPCEPSPCGPHSECRLYHGIPSCSCLPGFISVPPTCTQPCGFNSDCEKEEICLKQKCVDPCSDIPEFCGLHASCYIRNHNVHCSCPSDPNGDPFSKCSPGSPISPATNSTSPCVSKPNPCGPNSQCREINDTAVCSCLPGYVGSPPSCRPQCTVSSDCYRDLACINQRCTDPCPGTCGINAKCRAIEHNPICTCIDGHTGSPFVHCSPMNTTSNPTTNPPTGACLSSRCGLNTVCKDIKGTAVCNCLPGYMGSPEIGCRPECVNNLDCVSHLACINQKCKDPCPGQCADNATCQVIQHTPSCTCNAGYIGDPFFRCSPTPTSE